MALKILAGILLLNLELLRISWIEKDRIAVRRSTITMEMAEVRKVR